LVACQSASGIQPVPNLSMTPISHLSKLRALDNFLDIYRTCAVVDRNWNEPLVMISPHHVLLLFTSDMTFTMGPKSLFNKQEIFSYLKLEGDLKVILKYLVKLKVKNSNNARPETILSYGVFDRGRLR
jgi:hypothetical protein